MEAPAIAAGDDRRAKRPSVRNEPQVPLSAAEPDQIVFWAGPPPMRAFERRRPMESRRRASSAASREGRVGKLPC